ncbi:MAG: hypothetical protein LBS11_02885 [Oscillospiraceae bacterium]|jgi:predicted transposase/invertase (TIGR01784 family)|nr:hypothetical protein [Oscillospiraceae bacterium]
MLTEEFKLEDYVWAMETDGEERGLKKGRLEGIQMGEQRGIQMGIAQHNKETVLRMRKLGCDTGFIAAVTGLSEDEILRL